MIVTCELLLLDYSFKLISRQFDINIIINMLLSFNYKYIIVVNIIIIIIIRKHKSMHNGVLKILWIKYLKYLT